MVNRRLNCFHQRWIVISILLLTFLSIQGIAGADKTEDKNEQEKVELLFAFKIQPLLTYRCLA